MEPGEEVTLAVRSENISLDDSCQRGIKALVAEKSFSAGQLRLALKMEDGKEVIASRYGIDADVKVGQKVCFQFKAEDAVLVDREETDE